MKVFLSWSGLRSQAVATAINSWLPLVMQSIDPVFSADIKKGATWARELDDQLETTSVGIVCLTPENLKSEWIHFEVGKLSKTKEAAIYTLLLDLLPANVPNPLALFQATVIEKSDFYKLLLSINEQFTKIGERPLKTSVLETVFDKNWPELFEEFSKALSMEVKTDEKQGSAEGMRNETEKIDEVLEILRGQQRDDLFMRTPVPDPTPIYDPTEVWRKMGSRVVSSSVVRPQVKFPYFLDGDKYSRKEVEKIYRVIDGIQPCVTLKDSPPDGWTIEFEADSKEDANIAITTAIESVQNQRAKELLLKKTD
jgi:TIR domain